MRITILNILFFYSALIFSQSKDEFYFSGNFNINNNGIDWVPLFTRDKPSLIANFSFVNKRFPLK